MVVPISQQRHSSVIRWVMTKEEHCSKIITLISEYCLCQRVKPAEFSDKKDYTDALVAHHAVMQAAMKAKQSVDPAAAETVVYPSLETSVWGIPVALLTSSM